MAHPKKGYYLSTGIRVPGTTTIIGRFKEIGALMYWACQQGQKNPLLPTREALYGVRDEAAATGTGAHFLVYRHIHGEKPYDLAKLDVLDMGDDGRMELDDTRRQALQSAFDAYLAWERMTKLKVIEQEVQLVSSLFKFGGCPDAVGLVDKVPCLLDWKTSKSIYPDMLLQLAAYGYLVEKGEAQERDYTKLKYRDKRYSLEGFHLLKFSKEHGDFSHHYFPELEVGWEQFKLFRKAYDNDRVLKKRAA